MEDIHSTFLEAHRLYSRDLFRYCFARVGNNEFAEDLLQDCFARTLVHIALGHTIRNMRAFFYKVLANLIVDHYRRRKNISLEYLQENAGFEPEYCEHGQCLNRVDGKRALAMLTQLAGPYREALSLRYVEGLGLAEMADALHESKNTVSVRLHRGLGQLRRLTHADELPSSGNGE